MKKFLLKQWHVRVETWQIALAGLVTLFALIGFGSLVMHADRNYEDAGPVSKLALKMAVLPAESQAVINELVNSESPDLARDQRFAGQTGFEPHGPRHRLANLVTLCIACPY